MCDASIGHHSVEASVLVDHPRNNLIDLCIRDVGLGLPNRLLRLSEQNVDDDDV